MNEINYKQEFEECRDDLEKEKERWELPLQVAVSELSECQEKNGRLKKTLGGYHSKAKKDNEEIKNLKALVEQSTKDTSILDALSFAFKTIINR